MESGLRAISRAAMIWVVLTLVVLYTVTTFADRAYHLARRSRAEASYRAGTELAARGRYAQAVADFRAASVYEHDDSKYRFALAQTLMALKRWNEAENYLLELRAEDPTSGPVNLALARVDVKEARDTDAVDNYHRAIFGSWPDHAQESRIATRFELIGLLNRDGRQKEVLAELLQLAGEIPVTDTATLQRVADALLVRGAPQHAADIYREILSAHPRTAAAEQGLGDAEFAMGDFASAHRSFDAAARFGGSLPGLAKRLALTNSILELDPTMLRLTANQRFDRARELLQRSLDASQGCTLPPDITSTAQQALSQAKHRQRNGETLEMLMLAQGVWRDRTTTCPDQAVTDQALAALMSKLLKQ